MHTHAWESQGDRVFCDASDLKGRPGSAEAEKLARV